MDKLNTVPDDLLLAACVCFSNTVSKDVTKPRTDPETQCTDLTNGDVLCNILGIMYVSSHQVLYIAC